MTDDEPKLGLPVSDPWEPETRRLAAIAVVVGVVALGFFFLFGVIDSIIIAGLLAFLIEPLLRFAINKLHAPRWLAITITYLLVAAIAFGAVLFLPILLINSIAQIDFAQMVADIDAWLSDLATSLEANGFLGIDLSGMAAVGEAASQPESGGIFDPGFLLGAFADALVAAAGALGVVVSLVTSIFFVVIIAVYLSVDSSRLLSPLPGLAKEENRAEVTELGRRLNQSWSDYIRGQGIMVLVIGFTTFVVTWLLGLPGALFLGVIAGLLEVIPTFGPIIATIPAVLIALFQGSTRFELSNFVFALIVIVAYILIQQLESNIIAPKVMGHSVTLPPIIVLISITAAYQVAGILGAILAVPVVANARIILSYVWAKVQSRDPWVRPT
ncbi:MAG TPA: AI-2E family transporter [Acidimicrobiia bacterium]|nr:AI-2E family transporter [Acidimicrobiia bacterium]